MTDEQYKLQALLDFYYAMIALSAKQTVERSDLIAEIGKCRSNLEKYNGR